MPDRTTLVFTCFLITHMYAFNKSRINLHPSYLMGIILMSLCLLFSCESKEEIPAFDLQKGILVRITNPAGELSDFIKTDFLPPPFNIGEFENNQYQFIVLSSRIKKGKAVRVMPIANVEFRDSLVRSSYIVGIPTDSSIQNLQIEGFGQLVSDFPYVKSMIDQWLIAQNNFIDGDLYWRSEQLSLDLLNK